MLHDLYPREEMAENEEIIATRLGSQHFHEKGSADEGWAVHTEQGSTHFPSLHPQPSAFPKDGAAEGVLGTQSLHPAAAWAPFAAGFFTVLYSPPHPFLSIHCAAKRRFREGL